MERRPRGRMPALGALALVLAAPASASAQTAKPAVSTGGVAKVAIQSATLKGAVDPNGSPTTYFFRIGTTTVYGGQTPAKSAGAGANRVAVSAPVDGLAPATTYHYRLIARNRNGVVRGADRALTTKPQPLGVTLAATPNPVPFGGAVTLAGQLTGTGNAGRQVVLQSNPFPYTAGFQNAANVQVTDAAGNFSFPLLSVPLNTQYRVLMPARPAVVSPIVSVGVAVKLTTHLSSHRIRRGSRVRFSGVVRPARDGAQVAIQKKRGERWVTITGTITHHGGSSFSRYSKRATINRGGIFRVWVGILDGNYVSNEGTHMHVRTHR